MSNKTFRELCVTEVLGGKSRWVYLRLLKVMWSLNPSRKAVLLIRLVQHFKRRGIGLLSRWFRYRLVTKFGVYLDPGAELGEGLKLPHPTSIVIGNRVKVGERCLIYQQVTLGAAPKDETGMLSRAGDDVTLYPGAKFVGKGRVGNRVVVGANAVVSDVFGDDVVLAGIPARVVRPVRADDRVGALRAS